MKRWKNKEEKENGERGKKNFKTSKLWSNMMDFKSIVTIS